MTSKLGTADFDLAKYANEERAHDEKLPLKNCLISKEGYIDIYIKCKTEGGPPQNNGSAPHPSM